MFSMKATKIDETTIDLTLCIKCQIDGDFVNFCGFHRKHELYKIDFQCSSKMLIYNIYSIPVYTVLFQCLQKSFYVTVFDKPLWKIALNLW